VSGCLARVLRAASAVPAVVFSILWWILLFRGGEGEMFGHPVAEVLAVIRPAWLASMALFGIANGIASWNSEKSWIRFAFLGMGLIFVLLFIWRLF
jgi:ABC-type branched-subunit amino acid transport system permease subunit